MIITIVTPTLNSADTLRECVESVRAAERPGVEIEHVIVDGGSADATLDIAARFGLRVIHRPKNGIFDAINAGSFDSSGEMLGFLGGDDVILPEGARRVAEARRATGARWVVGAIRWLDGAGQDIGGLSAPPLWMTPGPLASLGWNPVMHVSTYFARDFFTELGGFDAGFRIVGDYDMFLRARAAAPYARVRAPIGCFRRTGVNTSAERGPRVEGEIARVRERFAPPSAAERALWRAALKLYFNATAPRWLAYKLTQPLRLAVGAQPRRYFC